MTDNDWEKLFNTNKSLQNQVTLIAAKTSNNVKGLKAKVNSSQDMVASNSEKKSTKAQEKKREIEERLKMIAMIDANQNWTKKLVKEN